MLPAHLRQQAFQERRHEVVEAVRGNPNDAALRAQLAQAEHDLEATTTAMRVLEVECGSVAPPLPAVAYPARSRRVEV
jgi:hypothetical protein